MLHNHHSHGHHHHSHGGGHHHGLECEGDDHGHASSGGLGRAARFGLAGLLVAIAVAAACFAIVSRGEAVVVTRFGDPVRVISEPGLAVKAPAPIENVTRVDLRLHSFSSGLQDVGTKDGLRVLMQAYVVWRVGDQPDEIIRFLRAVRNEPDTAAAQLRSFTASTLEIASARFDLASLVNTDQSKLRLDDLETFMRETLQAQVDKAYGIIIRQVGVERLTLPPETLDATVARMTAERLTVAQERTAEGNRVAADIRSGADRDSRIAIATARSDAAETEAKARLEAAAIYGDSYRANPDLYRLLRSLDTLSQVVGDNTRLILRTDAAPFRAFVEKPADAGPEQKPDPKAAANADAKPDPQP